MRLIFWIDQRMRGSGFWWRRGLLFFRHGLWLFRLIGLMADCRQHGKGEHDQRDMPVPTMPGAGLILVEAALVLGGLEAVFDPLRSYSTCCAGGTLTTSAQRWPSTPTRVSIEGPAGHQVVK